MSHEITATDNVVLHRNAAWHGLGTIVADAPTPTEALQIAGLNWEVRQCTLIGMLEGGDELPVEDRVMNYRSDTMAKLGIVGCGYKPIQNQQIAEFCEMLAEQGDQVKIESAGSIRGGEKVWFLMKGESFSVRDRDEIATYLLASSGHDGITSLKFYPTGIRVVCSNTFHMVTDSGKPAKFVANHTENIEQRIEEAKAALGLYSHAIRDTRSVIDQLAARDVKREDVQQFFLECYTSEFGAIPTNPKTKVEQNRRDRAMGACNAVFERFDNELEIAGPTAWNMMNAWTGWEQNDRAIRIKDPARAAERRDESRLLGAGIRRANSALITALST